MKNTSSFPVNIGNLHCADRNIVSTLLRLRWYSRNFVVTITKISYSIIEVVLCSPVLMNATNRYHPQSSISEYRERNGAPYFEKGKGYTNRSYSRYRRRQVNELSDIDFERLYFKESFLQNPWKEDV